jgi:hypothetical protein
MKKLFYLLILFFNAEAQRRRETQWKRENKWFKVEFPLPLCVYFF